MSMSDRLRSAADMTRGTTPTREARFVMREAADELDRLLLEATEDHQLIEALQAENDRLRADVDTET